MNERILCLDIGDIRIGVAVSDPSRIIASPVEVIHRVGWGPDTKKILSLCEQYQTNHVLSGLPLNMDGTEGFQAEKVRAFCSQLEKAGLQVFYMDERLSTVSAEDLLIQGGVSRIRRKQVVDKIAASVILQQWLDGTTSKTGGNNMNDEFNDSLESNGSENELNALTEGDLIEMIDDDGQTITFIFVDALEYDNKLYLALADPEEDDAVFFLQIDQDEDGNDVYTAPDEKLEDVLFEVFSENRSRDEEN